MFSPFMLNFRRLNPGEAIFLAANEPHAYVSGDCFEVMANSNNVVRMGCTPKLRDVPVLTEMLTFSSGLPKVLNGESVSENVQIYTPTDSSVTEFQLERISLNPGESYLLPPSKTPSIIVMLDGKVMLVDTQSLEVKSTSSQRVIALTYLSLRLQIHPACLFVSTVENERIKQLQNLSLI